MALTPTPLDGNNVSVEITAPDTTFDVLTLDMATGAASGPFLPDLWIRIIEERAKLFFTAISLAELSPAPRERLPV
jgi:hypothetical protein